jgi:membrane-associated protease RseP (regulator of RpoE activity)
LLLVAASSAETVKDREGAVRNDRASLEKDARWIYNDFRSGFAKAKETGKPLLVVLRCVPCLSCAGIDAQVLQEPALEPLLDRFVCVRLINANAIDLSLFQFDYDLSFSTLFFNGDGTVYGRYGSWTHQRDPMNKTTAGFKSALEAVLAIHRGYPVNKASLAGKQGGPTPFKTPVEIPSLAVKYKAELDWEGKVVQSCVHCHQVGDAFRASYREQGQAIPAEWIYPFPQPETIGVTLATDQVARVESVVVDSIAARSGIRAGDELVALSGQPLVSPADVSWALHRAPQSGSLAAVVKRGGAAQNLSIVLPAGWREQADISKRAGTWPMRGMALGGLVLEELPDEERAQLGIAKDRMALRAKGVGQFGKHAAAKNAGFQKGDIITEIDGSSTRATESELIGRLLKNRKVGERVKAKVQRGGSTVELSFPVQ